MNQDNHTKRKKIFILAAVILAVCIFVFVLFSSRTARNIFHIQSHPVLSQTQIQTLSTTLKTSSTTPLSSEEQSQIFKSFKSSTTTSPLSPAKKQELFQSLTSH